MKNISLDLSQQNDLRWLSTLVAALRISAAGIPFFLAGATARDLLLWYGHQIHTGRATRDVDVAVAVAGWSEFSALKGRLVASGLFSEYPNVIRDAASFLSFSTRAALAHSSVQVFPQPLQTTIWISRTE